MQAQPRAVSVACPRAERLSCILRRTILPGEALDPEAADPGHCLLSCRNKCLSAVMTYLLRQEGISGQEPKRSRILPRSAVWGCPCRRCCHSKLSLSSSPADCLPLLPSVLKIPLDSEILRRCQVCFCLSPHPWPWPCWATARPSGWPRGTSECSTRQHPCRKDHEKAGFSRAAHTLKALRGKPQPQFPNQVGSQASRSGLSVHTEPI